MKNSPIRLFIAVFFSAVLLLCNLSLKAQNASTLVQWDFPNNPDNATVDVSALAANSAATITTVGGTSALDFTNTGNATRSAYATGWDNGSGAKYWQINIATTGYYSLDLSSKQKSSNSGPQDFKVQYKIGSGGTWTDLAGATNILVQNDAFTSGVISNIPMPAECSNQPSLFIRWIMTSNEDVSAIVGNVISSGSSRIDEIVVRGTTGGNHYRSNASGNWSSTATWQISSDNVTWSAASVAPSATNANTINIRSGHTVTINSAVTADQINVNSGGVLDYSSNLLNLSDGSGVDLEVNGSFYDQSTTATSFATGATWVLGSSATILRTAGTSAAIWRDNYNLGMSTIPATANWVLRKISGTTPQMTTTGGTYYPNLSLESNTGTWSTASGANFIGTTDYPRIKGNFDLGVNGSQPISFYSDVYNNAVTPLIIPVGGNLTIGSGSTLTLGGATNGAGGFDITGNLVVNGTLAHSNTSASGSSRTIKFSGTGPQSISGTGSITAINTLVLNNSVDEITLSIPLPISSSITFTAGNLITSAVNLPTLANGATVTGASNSSYVDGPIAAIFSATPTITFPTGKGGNYRPIALIGVGGAGTSTFTAEYFNTGPNQASPVMSETSLGTGINHVSAIEYWKLARTGTGSRTAKINLGWTAPPYNASDLTLLSALRLASWDGTAWQNVAAATAGTLSVGNITSSAAPANYIAFSLASSTGDNPLPITLIDFTGKPMPVGNLLNWTSSSEKNNDHFSVERSQDMVHFEAIGEVKGNGSTEALSHYSLTDKKPLSGINYYRLRQFDFDGSNEVSTVIAIDANNALKTFTLVNDAANQQLLLRLQASESNGEATIIDLLGRKRLSHALPAGLEEQGISCSQLEHGIYFLLIQRDGETQVQKFFY